MRQYLNENIKNDAIEKAIEIMETIGIRFEIEKAREVFRNHGAKVDGEKILIPRKILFEALATTPKQDYLIASPKRVTAATPFSNAPFILDDETGIVRRCQLEDAIAFYKFNETSDLYECTNPGCADPIGNDGQDLFVAQVAMALKYSDKYLNLGVRATKSTSKNGNVYESARKAFRMAREFYDIWDAPVLTQGICPNPPLAYDAESLDNLFAAVDEKQDISLFPCSIGFMTAPETILGVVIHDFAMALSGLVLVQLMSPGHPVSFCEFSTIINIKTLQPNYGSVEGVYIQVAFYELCKAFLIPCSLSGSYADGTQVDYQAGMESTLTALLPFQLTEVSELWCIPGILSGFACGSFEKAILDEELMRNMNHLLKGMELTIPENLASQISKGVDAKSFLGVGKTKAYKQENYMTQVFNKWGISQSENSKKSNLKAITKEIFSERINSYIPPDRTLAQMKILNPNLPSLCRSESIDKT